MKIGITSSSIGNPDGGVDAFVDEAKRMEERGFAFLAAAHIFGIDTLMAIAVAGRETSRIELGTAVVPVQPRHPHAMAQQALTAQAASSGRLILGIGLSHQLVIENLFGLSYAKPARHMREYLEVLMPLLHGKPAAFEGEVYRVNASVQINGVAPPPVIVAALGPLMLKLAGRLADGTATWMTGERTLADHTVPAIRAAAEEAGRPEPRVMAALPIALCSDPAKARELANQVFQVYGTLPSYRAMLDREGAAGPGDVAMVGDEASLREGIGRLRDAGVSHFAPAPFPAEKGSVERTLDFLQNEV